MKFWKSIITPCMMAILLGALPFGHVLGETYELPKVSSQRPLGMKVIALSTSHVTQLNQSYDAILLQALKERAKTPEEIAALGTLRESSVSPNNLGRDYDFYQLQGQDSFGLYTAGVIIKKIPKESIFRNLPFTYKDEGLSARDAELLGLLVNQIVTNHGISLQKGAVFSSILDDTEVNAILDDVEPIQSLWNSNYGTVYGAARVHAYINGFAMPYYIGVAIVGTKSDPTAILMITSSAESEYFAPRFKEFVKILK